MNHITDDDLIDYLHHECDDATDARIHGHLVRCRDCRDRRDAEVMVGDLLRSSALAAERELPSLVKAGVWAAIRTAPPTFAERFRTFLSPALALPVAAVLAVAMYLGVPVLRAEHASSPTVAAAYYFEEHAAEGLENPLADHVNTNASLAFGRSSAASSSSLIDAADAATLDDVVASRQ
jgi:hypothetical protein